MDIPEYLNVEVSSLEIGHSLHVEDLSIPGGVDAIYDTNFTLVTVVPPTVEEAPAEEAPAVAVEGVEAPEAVPEEKKEEEAEES